MLHEIAATPKDSLSSFETAIPNLLRTVRVELDHLQLYKKAEWHRQQQAIASSQSKLKGWLARLLCCKGIEDIMDTANIRVHSDPSFLKMNSTPFVNGPPGKGRYIFALSEAKQSIAVTGIYMVCLNLPPHS
ncbi:hypothetical protein C8Q80DRAFT_1217333 [Daedaleopsis nitida]|nr:hypothetical protein C8Q80DRAFT_1217333 [Daedaleopsis nitida]